MSDFIQADQQPSPGAAPGGPTAPLSYTQARLKWQSAKEQTTDSRMDYLSAKNFGTNESVFVAAVVLAEAYCNEVEAHDAFEELVVDENWRLIQSEREAIKADELMAALNEEAESA